MCPSFNSFGSLPSISQLLWDTDLIIPAGKAIESASGEVAIAGDVSISGSVSSGGGITAGDTITTQGDLIGDNAVLSGKTLVVNSSDYNAIVTLTQVPTSSLQSYTSPDFDITDGLEGVQYIVPPVTYTLDSNSYDTTTTFSIQGKMVNGSYQTISSGKVYTNPGEGAITTQPGISPPGITAIRYTIATNGSFISNSITSGLSLILSPLPVFTRGNNV